LCTVDAFLNTVRDALRGFPAAFFGASGDRLLSTLATTQSHGTRSWREPSVVPGFGLTFGMMVVWLSLIVIIPLIALVIKASTIEWDAFVRIVTAERTFNALRLSFGLSFLAALLNAALGLVLAWALVRYRFPGRRIADAIVDIPFALPTAVAGIALTSLYAPNGLIGSWLATFGIKVAFTPLGIFIALVFVGLPFAVRTVQPVLADLEAEVEQAAASLGASRWQTITRVILPTLAPAILTGFALAFARAVGEYGSVIFIAGNLPNVSEIAPLLIIIRLEEYRYADATVIACLMLIASFAILLVINRLQRWSEARG
jgi:sulfate transport system permease protein